MKRRKGRKLFSLLLTAALVLSLSGIVAFATESGKQAEDEISEETAEQDLSFKSSKVSKTTDDAPFTNSVSGAQGKVTYTSSNKSVATVDKNGKVTIAGAGTATITATDEGNGKASFSLTVAKPSAKAATESAVTNGDSKDDADDESDDEADKVEEDSEEAGDSDEDEESDEDDETDEDAESDEDGEEVGDTDEDGEEVGEAEEDAESDEDGEEAVESDEDEEEVGDTDEDGEEAGEAGEDAEPDEDAEVDEDEETDEAGDEADSFVMDEPLLAEMTGMTVSYYSTAATGREEQDLSFSAGNTVNKEIDDAPFINPLNGAVGDVDYISSDESVASVDGGGIVTINGTGTAIITAEASGNSEYETTRISYLTVVSEDSESEEESEGNSESEGYSISLLSSQSDTMNIRVALTWEGDTESMRPESVSITLLADGSEKYTATLTESGGWDHTWTNLPVYSEDNVKIEYTVKEVDTPSGYTASYADWFNDDNDTYSIIVTNTWGVESDTTGTDGPKTADINFWVLYMYLAVLSGAVIITLSVCRRASRR